ncbi:sigma-70 family RNA polymerase sigma factor [Streptomyces olivaceus]|uniref:Sigma-70 family RNA polymerase sigma factor n=1 Tax=Streptomyces olivaceus TaxID=47716 RepID=A0ABS7WGZ5_STROV|nr:sigma-70 family RNA polymerase sigma factor [Streptomyces olivaceus]MBZ6086663.1 sigma-70 family RNA polymerase sigma factor [Streptomyces olivaceus]MBZ6093701.1 sigma-70 family RNA polymerase sigma factor [Streptomyces olivaceus]MBZ6100655.1 sigma-70 family RNA polymerase sigma factor [Streptomyces olivaceus]MBZ6121768.1 sigma-70 family RNA polymerase sigma factor [Streptomyces olivaceus]MBZ6156446.1 sigma-70 family RNA polymerase sigma factor [Streptomyces olivaceus]
MSEAAPGADFESFVLETIEAFSRLARTQAGDLHSAQDAVQDVYLNMYRRWETISEREGSLTAYGRTAVKRAVIDQFRRNKRMVTVPVPVHELPETESGIGIPDAAYEMIKEGIGELVSDLPERQREVITLCILQDLSTAEVAQRLQIKEESVKRYIKAAANNLKKSIDKHSEEATA